MPSLWQFCGSQRILAQSRWRRPLRRVGVSRKVEVGENESIESALRRLNRQQVYEYKRWTKSRFGFYQKPSELRRKARKMAEIWQFRPAGSRKHGTHLYLNLQQMFMNTAPRNAAGK